MGFSLDPSGIGTLLSNIAGAIKELFGFANKKVELNNTPEMKKADEAQKEQIATDADQKAIKKRDEDFIVNGTS